VGLVQHGAARAAGKILKTLDTVHCKRCFIAPDDPLAWLNEDDAFTPTGDNLLKLMTAARLAKISDHRIGSPRC